MPRPRKRACLEQGLKLNINHLLREGAPFTPRYLLWPESSIRKDAVHGLMTSSFNGSETGSIGLQLGDLDQTITVRGEPRPFGGCQWYFLCPFTSQRCSVLWMPLGAKQFGSRQAWRGQVAYASQFESPPDRAHRGKAKIKAFLIADEDPNAWELPPKPKWMRV